MCDACRILTTDVSFPTSGRELFEYDGIRVIHIVAIELVLNDNAESGKNELIYDHSLVDINGLSFISADSKNFVSCWCNQKYTVRKSVKN